MIEFRVYLEVYRVATRDGDGFSGSTSGGGDRGISEPTVIGSSAPAQASPTSPIPAAGGAPDGVIATLTAVEGDLVGETFELHAGENHLGRGVDCSIVLNSRWISRSHVWILCENGRIVLRVTEGKEVWVNDALSVERNLVAGDRIRLGTTILSLKILDVELKPTSSVMPVTPSTSQANRAPQVVARQPAPPLPAAKAKSSVPAATPKKKFKWRFWAKAVPTLVFLSGERKGDRVELTNPRFRIGGLDDNDMVITGHDASRNHAELRIRDGRVHIWDLRSVNGTWVNNQRIENKELRFGDVIRIGSEELRYED